MCFQSFATPRNRLKNSTAPFFRRGGGSFPPLKSVYPGGESTIPGGIVFFFIFPGGKTPCECFQAEKVVGGGGNRLGGGKPRLLRYYPRRAKAEHKGSTKCCCAYYYQESTRYVHNFDVQQCCCLHVYILHGGDKVSLCKWMVQMCSVATFLPPP